MFRSGVDGDRRPVVGVGVGVGVGSGGGDGVGLPMCTADVCPSSSLSSEVDGDTHASIHKMPSSSTLIRSDSWPLHMSVCFDTTALMVCDDTHTYSVDLSPTTVVVLSLNGSSSSSRRFGYPTSTVVYGP